LASLPTRFAHRGFQGLKREKEGTKSTLDNIIVLNLGFFFVILMSTNPSLSVYILFVIFKLEPKIKIGISYATIFFSFLNK
jgi:hypothetical protein